MGPPLGSLGKQRWKRVYIGGRKTIQSFMRERLIADLTLTTIPILIGGGVRLVGPLESNIDLELFKTKSFPSGLIASKCRVLQNIAC